MRRKGPINGLWRGGFWFKSSKTFLASLKRKLASCVFEAGSPGEESLGEGESRGLVEVEMLAKMK